MCSKRIIAVFVVLVSVMISSAADITWNGGSGLWHNASNWTPAQIPSPCDKAIFTAGFSGTITINQEVVVYGILLSQGATGTMLIQKNMYVGGSGFIQYDGKVLLSGSSISDIANLQVWGDYLVNTTDRSSYFIQDYGALVQYPSNENFDDNARVGNGYEGDYNYAKIVTALEPMNSPEALEKANSLQVSKSHIYFDAYNRSIQEISVNANPNANKHLIKSNVYESSSTNETKSGLVYAKSACPLFNSTDYDDKRKFYYDNPAQIHFINNIAFSEESNSYRLDYISKSDRSPSAELVETIKPDAWNQNPPNISLGNKAYKPIRYERRSNAANELLYWTVNDYAQATQASQTFSCLNPFVSGNTLRYWPEGSLIVNETTDEDGRKSTQYINDEGKVVASVYGNVLTTQYIYDSFGRLRHVLPPNASQYLNGKINANDYSPCSFTYTSAFAQNYTYSYIYNKRGLPEVSRRPENSATYTIYDKLDRPAFTQNELQAAQTPTKCSFTMYDNLSRPIYTGELATTKSLAQIQESVLSRTVQYETFKGTGVANTLKGYSKNVTMPETITEAMLQTVMYYGTYDLDQNETDDYSYQNQGMQGEAPELMTSYPLQLTVAEMRDRSSTSKWLRTVQFFDKYGRTVQTQSDNPLYNRTNNTFPDISTQVYDFMGKVLRAKVVHKPSANLDDKVELNTRFTYTPRHLPEATYVSITRGSTTTAEELVSNKRYNDLLQMIENNVGGTAAAPLQSIDYRYNALGMLKSINNTALNSDVNTPATGTLAQRAAVNSHRYNDDTNDLFGMEFTYEKSTGSNTPQYGGNISSMDWAMKNGANPAVQNSYGYTYNYDAASRLTAAVGTANAYNETLSYDANGNILALGRTNASATTIDNLAYTYPTLRNRLTSIAESSSNSLGYKALTTGSYTYDAAGNTTYDPARQMNTSYDSYLGLTKEQTLPNNQKISYDYSSQGTKLRRTTNLPTSQTTHYIGAFEYEQTGTASPTLSMIHLPGGRAIPNANGVKYEYYLTDHLGNVRMVFDNNNGAARIVQQSHYYPFGMTQTLYDNASQNKYLYNGKELEATGLNNYGRRMYDAIRGQWNANDKVAELYKPFSAFTYCVNNPVKYSDVEGSFVINSLMSPVEVDKLKYLINNTLNTLYNDEFLRNKFLEYSEMTMEEVEYIFTDGQGPEVFFGLSDDQNEVAVFNPSYCSNISMENEIFSSIRFNSDLYNHKKLFFNMISLLHEIVHLGDILKDGQVDNFIPKNIIKNKLLNAQKEYYPNKKGYEKGAAFEIDATGKFAATQKQYEKYKSTSSNQKSPTGSNIFIDYYFMQSPSGNSGTGGNWKPTYRKDEEKSGEPIKK